MSFYLNVSVLDNVTPSVELHKGCHCTYSSTKYKSKYVDRHVPEDAPTFSSCS